MSTLPMSTRVSSALTRDLDVADVVEVIGRDHALTPDELALAPTSRPDVVAAAWRLYAEHWGRFCGTGLDPQYCRLDGPALWSGTPVAADAAPIVVVGTGPSLRCGIEHLKAVRERVHIFTSPRGADALGEAGITPDLVIVEHRTPLDAQFTVQAMADRAQPWRERVPWLAIEARTPSPLAGGQDRDRLFVLEGSPTWGLWPATAVGLARRAGAAAIVLLGIDLGSPEHPDPQHRQLRELLSLLAPASGAACLDAGKGVAKTGWRPVSLPSIDGPGTRVPLAVDRARVPSVEARAAAAAVCWARTRPMITTARIGLEAALRRRDGDAAADGAVADGLIQLLDFGRDRATRIDVQDGLGCSFLPRYWRTAPDFRLGAGLWRPLALASHEMLQQHRALGALLRARGALR